VTLVAPDAAGQPAEDRPATITALLEAGRYEDAERAAAGWRQGAESLAGSAPGERARAIDLWVAARLANGWGAHPDTRLATTRSLRIWQQRPGRERQGFAAALRNRAGVLLAAGDDVGARSRYRQAAAADRANGDRLGLSRSLTGLGRALITAGRFEAAGVELRHALAVARETSAPSPFIAAIEERLGYLSAIAGRFDEALRYLDAAEGHGRSLAPPHPVVADVLNTLGILQWVQADYDASERSHRRAIELAAQRLRPDHPVIAYYQIELSGTLASLNRFSEARELLVSALALREAVYGSHHPDVAAALNDLGMRDYGDGEYVRAREVLERGLRIWDDRPGTNHMGSIPIVYNLGLVNQELGDYGDARRLYQRATFLWRLHFGPRHRHVARGLTSVGDTLAADGRYVEARRAYNEALEIRRGALGGEHPDVAETLLALSRVELLQQRSHAALSLAESAVRILERANLRDSLYARALTFAGDARARLGHAREARTAYERAIEALRAQLRPSHPAVIELDMKLGLLDAARGEVSRLLPTALDAAERARDYLRTTVGALAERQALILASTHPRPLDVALTLLADRDPAAIAAVEQILDAVVRNRSIVLDEMATRARLGSQSHSAEFETLRRELVERRQRLANLIVRPPEGVPVEALEGRILEARSAKESLERRLAEASLAGRPPWNQSSVGIRDVARALPARSALVSYVLYRHHDLRATSPTWTERYVAFVIAADGAGIVSVALGDGRAIDRLVMDWRVWVSAPRAQGAPARSRASSPLRGRLWDPVAPFVRDAARVLIVPDGLVHFVTFAALEDGRGGYLLESGPTLHYLATERDMLQPVTSRETRGLFAVGQPLYSPPAPLPGAAGRPLSRRAGCATLTTLRFDPLPATGTEVREAVAQWKARMGAEPVSLKLGADATEAAVKSGARGHRVLHLATHGFFLGQGCSQPGSRLRSVGGLAGPVRTPKVDNPLLLAGLAFAGANTRRGPPRLEDGILTAEEVAALPLEGTEWAVLSACDTGLGELRTGEGVLGLRRAFHLAGVRTVIMSLWSVDDDATRAWMRRLYDARLGERLDTAEAVKQASLRVLRQRRAEGLDTVPFYWAPFVAAGDWR
jgi:CHAT domain-containing protein/tetratricopeptide (TPR) repeat protein